VSSTALAFLIALTTGMLVSQLRQGETVAAVLAGLLLALTLTVSLVRGVRGLSRSRWHAVLDAFAEGELAKERQQVRRLPTSRSAAIR
jgi:hypothetical protein